MSTTTPPFIVLDDGTDRQRWLTARHGGVSATDIARLARGGANTWAAIRAEKAGKGRDFFNAAMQHGKDREPVIAGFAERMFGLRHSTALLAAADEPRFIATPDLLGEDEVGDIKTTVHDWESLDEVPGRYIDQVLWQMRVTGHRRGRLVYEAHENGVPLHLMPESFVIEWDAARVAHLESVAYEFLHGDEEPDEDAAVLDALVSDAVMRKEIADAATASYQRALAAIEEHLGGQPRRFEGSLGSLTRSADGVSKSIDTTRLKKERPEIAEQYMRESPRKGSLRLTPRTDEQEGKDA